MFKNIECKTIKVLIDCPRSRRQYQSLLHAVILDNYSICMGDSVVCCFQSSSCVGQGSVRQIFWGMLNYLYSGRQIKWVGQGGDDTQGRRLKNYYGFNVKAKYQIGQNVYLDLSLRCYGKTQINILANSIYEEEEQKHTYTMYTNERLTLFYMSHMTFAQVFICSLKSNTKDSLGLSWYAVTYYSNQ